MNRLLTTSDVLLLKEDQIPPHMREVAILSGYRSPRSSISQCALSVFLVTNETLNFWTHFIPTLYFVWQLIMFWDVLKIISDPYTWPFTTYMFTVCLYPLISALAHTFFSISNLARHIWFFLDYGALNLYGYGAGLLYKAYIFPDELYHTLFGKYFLEVLVFLCILSTFLSCFSRFVTDLFWVKIFRLGAFGLPWIWDSIPLIYRLLYSKDILPAAAENYTLQFFFSLLIGFFYASHLPERLAPGKFDFVGNSHQLLHICGILASHQQMRGALIDMETRKDSLFMKGHTLSHYWSLHVFFFVMFSILSIITVFSIIINHSEKKKRT